METGGQGAAEQRQKKEEVKKALAQATLPECSPESAAHRRSLVWVGSSGALPPPPPRPGCCSWSKVVTASGVERQASSASRSARRGDHVKSACAAGGAATVGAFGIREDRMARSPPATTASSGSLSASPHRHPLSSGGAATAALRNFCTAGLVSTSGRSSRSSWAWRSRLRCRASSAGSTSSPERLYRVGDRIKIDRGDRRRHRSQHLDTTLCGVRRPSTCRRIIRAADHQSSRPRRSSPRWSATTPLAALPYVCGTDQDQRRLRGGPGFHWLGP